MKFIQVLLLLAALDVLAGNSSTRLPAKSIGQRQVDLFVCVRQTAMVSAEEEELTGDDKPD